MKPARIKTVAIGVFRKDDCIFVAEGYDPAKGETFYRPLGGTIEFGERGQEALVRELREEIKVEATNLRYLGTIENIFTFNGQPAHEIVLVYEGDFADEAIYRKAMVFGYEAGGGAVKAVWKSLGDFGVHTPASVPLYPDGLIDLLKRSANDRTHRR
ncbi:MAG: NUDIX hydrolase [Chloroflexia bacterium]